MFAFFKRKPFDMYQLINGEEKDIFDRTVGYLKHQLEQGLFDLNSVPASYFLLGYFVSNLSECFKSAITDEGMPLSPELAFIPLACERVGLNQARDTLLPMIDVLRHNRSCGDNPIQLSPKDRSDFKLGYTVGRSDYLHGLMQWLGGEKHAAADNLLRWLRCQELDFEDFSFDELDNWECYDQRIEQVEKLMKQRGHQVPFRAGMM